MTLIAIFGFHISIETIIYQVTKLIKSNQLFSIGIGIVKADRTKTKIDGDGIQKVFRSSKYSGTAKGSPLQERPGMSEGQCGVSRKEKATDIQDASIFEDGVASPSILWIEAADST